MSLFVIQRPSISDGGETSIWNAVRNPILYTMLRRDYSYSLGANAGGFQRNQFTGVDVTANWNIGDEIYIVGGGKFATVTAVAFTAGNTLVTLDIPFFSASTDYMNNLTTRPSYRVEVEVYSAASVLLNIGTFVVSATAVGIVKIDVRGLLESHLISDIDADLTTSTQVFDDTNIYKGFYIKYREVWTGSAEAQTDDVANKFFATLSKMQIPSEYGGNLFNYVTFEDVTPPGKWITNLSVPRMYRGYPFLISAIAGDNLATNLIFSIEYFDKQDGPLTVETTGPASYVGKQLIWNIPKTGSGIPDDAAYATIRMIKDGGGDYIDAFQIRIHDACLRPIMLLGRNSAGGCLQWVFEYNQIYTYRYEDGRKVKRARLFTHNLNENEWFSLQDFFDNSEIYKDNITSFTSSTILSDRRIDSQVYTIDEDGNKLGVIVIPVDNQLENRNVLQGMFELIIEFPSL